VDQTLDDCLHEAMDCEGLLSLLRRMEAGRCACWRATAGAVAAGDGDSECPAICVPG
jgi:hypothetical protein